MFVPVVQWFCIQLLLLVSITITIKYQSLKHLFVSLDVWQQFIARYSINYPDLVDNRSCFKSISNSPLMSPEINHEFRSATSNTTRHLRLSESDCIVEDSNKVINNVVMFTGFDPATTKKYKTVSRSFPSVIFLSYSKRLTFCHADC